MNSESELKAKLNLSRSSSGSGSTKPVIAKVVLNPATGLTEIVRSKVRMVENIEQLSSELNAIALFHFPVFCYREVNVADARPTDITTFQVAERPDGRNL